MQSQATWCPEEGRGSLPNSCLKSPQDAHLQVGGLSPSQPRSSFLLPVSERMPADVFLPYWSGGRDTALDVTVTHPLQAATVAGAAVTPGHAASEAYKKKMKLVGEECGRQGKVFIPVAMESIGGLA